MGTAISKAVRIAIGNQASHGAVSKMARDATIQMLAQPEVLSMIAGGLKKSDKLMSPITKFVATAVK